MEDHATRLKRLRMRSWHRGIKEMDLILGGFADDEMKFLSLAELDRHEVMMSENDHDLYQWVSGQVGEPETYRELMDLVRVGAVGLTKP